ncbi:MAG: universal stress protein [Oligoflexales bacterium]
MNRYMNILVAVGLNQNEDEQLLRKALDLSKGYKAKLNLVHVISPIYNYGMSSPEIFDCVEKHEAYARKRVAGLGTIYEIPRDSQFVKVGAIKKVIVDLVEIVEADLLIMGNHKRHGINGLFFDNNTVNLVKNTGCDMLAVRVA